ncbi:MAG: DUF4837 family protein [Bacteroidia bacterium]
MKLIHLFTILLLFVFSSCSSDIKSDDFKTDSSGMRGEVLIFMDEFYWEREAGQEIQKYFGRNLHGTPQAEPILEIRNYPLKNFNRNHKANRNIVYVKFDKELSKLSHQILRDKWVKNQLYVEIKSPSVEDFIAFMDKNGITIVEMFLLEERKRVAAYFNSLKSEPAIKKIEEKHKLRVVFPKDYNVGENKTDFVWATNERMITRQGRTFDLQQGFFVYHYPYTSDSTFHLSKLIEKRNSVLKKHVKGGTDDVYMTTQMMNGYQPKADTVNLNGKFAVEIRGQYRMENDFMGGPFISLTTLDEKNNRVITVEGYVFAPNSPKRELIRDLEAILYSLEF